MNHPTTFRGLRRPGAIPRVRRGFSFTEVLFAVMILGTGFIMVAGIFPVAIQQTRVTTDETMAAEIAVNANAILHQLGMSTGSGGTDNAFPQTGGVILPPIPTGASTDPGYALWIAVKGNLINNSNPSYAWVPFFSRDVTAGNPQSWSQVIILCLHSRVRDRYDYATDINSTAPNFIPRLVKVSLATGGVQGQGPYQIADATSTDVAAVSPPTQNWLPANIGNLVQPSPNTTASPFVRPGTFLIMAEYGTSLSGIRKYFIYRVGGANGANWTLQPGWDAAAAGFYNGATVTPVDPYEVGNQTGLGYIIGADTMGKSNTAAGTAQDIGCYVSFVATN